MRERKGFHWLGSLAFVPHIQYFINGFDKDREGTITTHR